MTDINNIIKKLEMIPHPEGGHYSETFRDKKEYFSHIFYLLKNLFSNVMFLPIQ